MKDKKELAWRYHMQFYKNTREEIILEKLKNKIDESGLSTREIILLALEKYLK